MSQRLISRFCVPRVALRSRASAPPTFWPRAGRRNYASAAPNEEPLTGAADNAFNRERRAVKAHAAASSDLWRKLSLYVCIPALIIGSVNAWNLWNEHWEHWEHMPPLEERPQYDYLNIRTKNFCWGDGDKTLFWNPKVNYHKRDDE